MQRKFKSLNRTFELSSSNFYRVQLVSNISDWLDVPRTFYDLTFVHQADYFRAHVLGKVYPQHHKRFFQPYTAACTLTSTL